MFRALTALGILLVAVTSATAQDTTRPEEPRQYAALVLKGGFSTNSMQVTTPGVVLGNQIGTGLTTGMAVTLPADRRLAFQTELLLHEQPALSLPDGATARGRAVFVVPLLMRMQLARTPGLRVGALVGPEFSVSMSRAGETINEYDDYGVAMGLDIEFRQRAVVDLRYTRGLLTLEPGIDATELARSRGVSVLVGWRFY